MWHRTMLGVRGRLESLWSEQKELKELKELKVKCGWRKSVNQQIRYGFMKRVS